MADRRRGTVRPTPPCNFEGGILMSEKIKHVIALDADKMKFRYSLKDRVGGNGFGLSHEGCMYTLNTIDLHMVAIIKTKRRNK